MISLNKINGAEAITSIYVKKLLEIDTGKPLIGVEMGSAYGGGVETIGKLWKGKGKVYGFDTFEGHPKHLVKDQTGIEATCMDNWYDESAFGTKKLAYKYQRKELDRQGLDNVILVKGEVNKDSCKDIPYINYCLLDMDIYESMKAGYEAVKDKIEPDCVLFLHDVMPPNHIPRLFHFFTDEVLGKDGDKWDVIGQWASSYLVALIKK